MKQFCSLAVHLFFLCLVPFCLQAAVQKTLSGRVSRTDTAREVLYVNFTHPATEVVSEMPFYVTQETGLNGYRALSAMKPGEIVTVDYEDARGGEFKALYVAKFRADGPPTGMENFKGL